MRRCLCQFHPTLTDSSDIRSARAARRSTATSPQRPRRQMEEPHSRWIGDTWGQDRKGRSVLAACGLMSPIQPRRPDRKTTGVIGSYRRFSLTHRRRLLTGSHTGTCSGTGLQITLGAACSTAVDGILSESPVMQDKPAPSQRFSSWPAPRDSHETRKSTQTPPEIRRCAPCMQRHPSALCWQWSRYR